MKKIIFVILPVLSLVAWVYAIMEHFAKEEWLMLAVSAFIPPIGAINGAGMYFGLW